MTPQLRPSHLLAYDQDEIFFLKKKKVFLEYFKISFLSMFPLFTCSSHSSDVWLQYSYIFS